MRVGQPSVEREERHLDGEGEEESPEKGDLLDPVEDELAAVDHGHQGGEVKGAGAAVDVDDAGEHQH